MAEEEKSVLVTVHYAKLPTGRKEEFEGKDLFIKVNDSDSQNTTSPKPSDDMTWDTVIGLMTDEEKMTVSICEDGSDEPFASEEFSLVSTFLEPSTFHKNVLKLRTSEDKTAAKVSFTTCHMPGLKVSEEVLGASTNRAPPGDDDDEDAFSDEE